VDMIYRLQAAGVRVPAPYQFIDGVLVMELVTDANGQPAPRLGEVDFSPEQATVVHERLLREVVRMLCAGVVHGDLSDFNVLMGTDGPVIIDLPQAVDPSKNQNARGLLVRDVDNLQRFLRRFVPSARRVPYAEEMWALYESNRLTPETVLQGQYRASQKRADTGALLELIAEVNEDERRRRAAEPQNARRPRRVEINVEKAHAQSRRPPSNRKQPQVAPRTAIAATGGLHTPSVRHFPAVRGPRPTPHAASDRAAAPAAPQSENLQPAAPPARRRRRRKPRHRGAVPKPATGGANVGERSERPPQARPQRPPDAQRPAAEAGRRASNDRRQRPTNPPRPTGSR
jgi:RIO kinase 1